MYHAYAAHEPKGKLKPHDYSPPTLGADEVAIKIECCGLCYSDVHLIDDDWKISKYPLVPGHEIIGNIEKVGAHVKNLHMGDRVGVGWQCGACLKCENCLNHYETVCPSKIRTCVEREGGFADRINVNSNFVYPIPAQLASTEAAPLLCAGITVYSPFKIYNVKKGHSVAVIGIGGLGHLALQFARAFGYKTTALSTAKDKEAEAKKFGADEFLLLSEIKLGMTPRFDFILSTVYADLQWASILSLLKPDGKLCLVGLPSSELKIPARLLVSGNRSICGSGTGCRHLMREMLQFSADHAIHPQVEAYPISRINEAVIRLKDNKARYRIVLHATN